MSIFDKIKNAIFGRQAEAAEQTQTPSSAPSPAPNAGTTPAATPASPSVAPSGASPEPQAQHPTTGTAPGAPTATPTPTAASNVDVAAILEKAVKDSGQKLDWRRSVVDLMKALDLDSSLSERKELAHELGYTGSTDDSATMNVWLHKALMKKLAENGGKVPAELTD